MKTKKQIEKRIELALKQFEEALDGTNAKGYWEGEIAALRWVLRRMKK